MKSVAIVGLGWLGLPLARHLKQMGWLVKGTKRTHDGVESMCLLRLEAYHLELTPEINADPDDLSQLLDVDALIINIPPSQYFFDVQQYVAGVQNLVQEALLHSIQQIIFISSTSIFPDIDGNFAEDQRPQPNNPIGQALLEIEDALFQLQDVDCDVIRFAGLVGSDRHPVNSLAGRENLPAGNQPVNLVHIDDCLRAIQLLLETSGSHRLYHLCAPLHPAKASYYQKMAEKLEKKTPHFLCSEQDPKRIIVADKICQELDFVYQYPDPEQMLPTLNQSVANLEE